MATNQAETGAIASQAGASTGGLAANLEAGVADSQAGTPGAAEFVAADGADASENAANSGQIGAEIGEKAADSTVDKVKTSAKAKQTTKNVVDATKKLVETVLDEAAKADSAVETKKIKVVRSHPGFAYNAGETGDLPVKQAEQLVAEGFAQFVSEDGEPLSPVGPSQTQLASAKGAYERFVAVADAETEGEAQQHSPAFADLPHGMQCAFVAAVDPTYTHATA